MPEERSSSETPSIYSIANPEVVPLGRTLSALGPGYVDFVCQGGSWYILQSSCSQGYVPPASGPGGQCTTNGSVVRVACVPGTDSSHAQKLLENAVKAASTPTT